MEKQDVVRIYNVFEANNIQIWLDGGWGIDALLGNQTRPHKDLDITVSRRDVKKLRDVLSQYKENPENSSEKNFVLEDSQGNQIDVHVFEFDDQGNNIYGILYPKPSLSEKGKIGTQVVNCISPEWVIKFHSYYEPKQKDLEDIRLLCERFKLEPPENYQ